jgi:hypothetical protein
LRVLKFAQHDSNAARKAYARHLKEFEIYSVQRPPKMRKYEDLLIGFSNEDFVGVSLPYSDALVVILAIANHKIRRVLADSGSSADIIYKSAFELMSMGQGKLVPAKGSWSVFPENRSSQSGLSYRSWRELAPRKK